MPEAVKAHTWINERCHGLQSRTLRTVCIVHCCFILCTLYEISIIIIVVVVFIVAVVIVLSNVRSFLPCSRGLLAVQKSCARAWIMNGKKWRVGPRLKQFPVGKFVIYERDPQICGDTLLIFFFTKIWPRKWGRKGYRRLEQQGLLCVCGGGGPFRVDYVWYSTVDDAVIW
jgi:hypothetical protein